MMIRVIAAAALVLGGSAAAAFGQDDPRPAATDHREAQAGQPGSQARPAAAPDHEDHSAHQTTAGEKPYPAGIPPLTEADRAAAFPDIRGQHTVHDSSIHAFVLFDQLEWQKGRGASHVSWDNKGWIGGDLSRFWFRSEGEGAGGRLESAQIHGFYGRAIARWWDVVVGVRQDVRPGPARTWAAIGLQGLAPYWFEVEATAYVGEAGRTHVRFETEYELLLTNRLVLQPLVEIEIYGKADPERSIGAGVSSMDAGFRLRYELKRELAPYVGITWNRRYGATAEYAEAAGEETRSARVVAGVRAWF